MGDLLGSPRVAFLFYLFFACRDVRTWVRDIFVECFILFSTCAIYFSSLRIIRASSAGGVARRARFKKGENSVNSCACGKTGNGENDGKEVCT